MPPKPCIPGSLASSSASVSPSSSISTSHIPLSTSYEVHFAVYASANPLHGYQDVETARRRVADLNEAKTVPDCLCTYSQLSGASQALWVFAIEQESLVDDDDLLSLSKLSQLDFNGLTRTVIDRFSYADIYPCTEDCSLKRRPCLSCTSLDAANAAGREPACHFPRHHLRQPLAYLRRALQDCLCNTMCEQVQASGRTARRMKNGMLWGLPGSSSNWGDDWEQTSDSRSLLFCHLDVNLLRAGISVLPRVSRTSFLPFLPSLPLEPGTPIQLLPFSTPAYFLNMYQGPSSALAKHFSTSLQGLGVGDFLSLSEGKRKDLADSPFVIAWVAVQNKNGEEKGLMIIWPATLCLSIASRPKAEGRDLLYAYGREKLPYIPELPAALQASPVPVPASVAPTALSRATSPYDSLFSPSVPGNPESRTRTMSPEPTHPQEQSDCTRPALMRASESMSSEAAHALKSLTVHEASSSDLRKAAAGAGTFVDFLAKERDRERERIRREKEAAAAVGSQANANKVNTPIAIPTPGVESSIVTAEASRDVTLEAADTVSDFTQNLPLPGMVLPSFNPGLPETSTAAPEQAQASYPSPPEEEAKNTHAATSESIPATLDVTMNKNDDKEAQERLSKADTFDGFIMDLDMDFGMAGANGQGQVSDPMKMEFDPFGTFTDDDFNFFDDAASKPGSTALLSANEQPFIEDGAAKRAMESLGLSSFDSWLSNTGSSSAIPAQVQAPTSIWDGEISSGGQAASAPPALTPGSDGGESSSSPGPATPGIINSDDALNANEAAEPFAPISFSDGLSQSDVKYAEGKFRRAVIRTNKEDVMTKEEWKRNYELLTDPRAGIVNRLIGVKRKLEHDHEGRPHTTLTIHWPGGEWDDSAYSAISPVADESDRDSEDETEQYDDDYVSSIERPSTPLSPNLPPGPSLVATQFTHSILLSHAIPLRPPNASTAFGSIDLASPLPNPVPTPVSPAALAGVSSEKLKVLEGTVGVLGKELCENLAFANAWRANRLGRAFFVDKSNGDWNWKSRNEYMRSIGWKWEMETIQSYAYTRSIQPNQDPDECCSLKRLVQPSICVGKAGSLLDLAPSALRFWSKLGLTPRSGPKDVTAFVLYEDHEGTTEKADRWLETVSNMYSARGFGTHKRITCGPAGNGLVPVQSTTLRKTLVSLFDQLTPPVLPVLIYVVLPASILDTSSHILRQLLTAIRRSLANREENAIRLHLVPDYFLRLENDASNNAAFESLLSNVYDKVLRPVNRFTTRPNPSGQLRRWFRAPAFTLSNTSARHISFEFNQRSSEMEKVDARMFLHVAYTSSESGKWHYAACIDQRGSTYNFEVWMASEDRTERSLVEKVWSFAMDTTNQANLEWHITFTKMGKMVQEELLAWKSHFAAERLDLALHLTVHILSMESCSWSVLQDTGSSAEGSASFADSLGKNKLLLTSFSTFCLSNICCTLSPESSSVTSAASQSCISEDVAPFEDANSALPLRSAALVVSTPDRDLNKDTSNNHEAHLVHLFHSSTSPRSNFVCKGDEVLDEICQNFHELAVLTGARWTDDGHSPLPYHLSALETAGKLLDLDSIVVE